MFRSDSLKPHDRLSVRLIIVGIVSLAVLSGSPGLASAATSAKKRRLEPVSQVVPVIPPGSAYKQANLVSDLPGIAFVLDPLLVNPWGIATRGTSPFWVANNGTSTSTLYVEPPASDVLSPNAGFPFITFPGGLPTGIVANSTLDFVVTSGPTSGPASFLSASITGNILGWNASVPAGSTSAIIAASNPGHVYTGVTLGNNGVGNFLYAADFANGTIDVFNNVFALQLPAAFPFVDPTIPTVAGNTYHPHNIQNIGGLLYVTYAKVGSSGLPENGAGNGFVRRFNTNGVRDLTFGINNGALDAPWGITIAPATFGIFGGALLVGNFSDAGAIHAYNPTTGAFLGTLQNEAGTAIEIDQLWGLAFGNGGSAGDVGALYFAAGIGAQEHGLFGSIRQTTVSATTLVYFSSSNYVVGENSGQATITVIRDGDVSGTSTVNYALLPKSQVGHASLAVLYREGTPLPLELGTPAPTPYPNQGYERKPGGASGSTQDTGNNSADFQIVSPSNPQNLASALTPSSGTASISTGVVISEIREYGPGPAAVFGDAFIELYNNTNAPVDVSGWKIKAQFSASSVTLVTINPGTTIPARGHFLATRTPGYTGGVPGDQTFTQFIFWGGIALTRPDDTIVDQVDEEPPGSGDVLLLPGTLTFAPGETSKTFQIGVLPDSFVEGNEVIDMILSNPTGAGLGEPDSAILTITDASGAPPPATTLSISDVAMNEGNGGTTNFVFTVTMSAPSVFAVTVDFAAAPDTAITPSDYGAGAGSVTFMPGQTSRTFIVPVVGDLTIESTETFFVNLSNAANATISDGQGVGTILNDDLVVTTADVSITKTAPVIVTPGSPFTYSISVASLGTSSATSVVVTDPLPAGVTFVSAIPSQGSCSGTTTVTCALGTIASGASAAISINVTAPGAAVVLSNTATVTAAADTNPGNNSSTAVTGVGVSPSSIPTLSGWMLLLLAMAMCGVGAMVLRR